MVAPSKGEIFEDARAHEVFPWRALYELTKTKKKTKKELVPALQARLHAKIGLFMGKE